MSRSLQSRQPSNGSGRQPPGRDRDPGEAPADRETGRHDERAHGAHKLRDDRGDDGDDRDHDGRDDRGDDYDYDERRELLTGDRRSRLPTRDDRDDDDLEALPDDDPDIMEVLDLDDLNRMDGPDA